MSRYRWTEAEVLRALGSGESGGEELTFRGVSTDSRGLEAGELFVALTGEHFDAHAFLGEVAARGARGAIVARVPPDAPQDLRYFVVDDPRHALGRLALHRRRALRGRVIGVAGSNGKTTTKDLLRAALGERYRVHATEGNLNNQVGLPLSLLAAPDEAEMIVLEMGTNEPGEIAALSRIAEPDLAVITVVAEEHLEKLGDLRGVLREETSLLHGLPASGVAFVSDEPPALAETAAAILGPGRVRIASYREDTDLHPDGGPDGIGLRSDGTTAWSWRGIPVRLPLRGLHNVRNALLALGVAVELGVEPEAAVEGVERLPQPKLRGEWRSIGGMQVIADCYNSNPGSLTAAMELLSALPAAGRKVAVIGTMREMGEQEVPVHRRAAEQIAALIGEGVDRVVATGRFVAAFEPYRDRLAEAIVLCEDPLEAYERIAEDLHGDETILLKASRGEALERWIPLLERDWGRTSDE